ncbi:MAG TPA: peptide-methionine (S)-S-oxide reductase MsrA [Vicinamibacteria bacterium]|nr:peptide-methionine (S)-S-oxide reductase MsrA [Vicinamibacteria bacterium]
MQASVSARLAAAMFLASTLLRCAPGGTGETHAPRPLPAPRLDLEATGGERRVVFAAGCFWCTEAVFEAIPGVRSVVSGYAGDTRDKATYGQVSWGRTKHAESIEIAYDPQRVTYGQLLRVFFAVAHDPTQLDRQGPDSGRQYRSAIFYATEDERQVAEAYIRQLTEARAFDRPLVTTLENLEGFYPAEAYHQDFVAQHPTHPYVVRWALPKLEKARKFHAGG